MTQIAIRSFCLNKARLDEQFGKTDEPESIETQAPRFRLVHAGLGKEVVDAGYSLFCGRTLYRGLPERVLVVDNNAPFCFSKDYEEKVDDILLNAARNLNLPYEPENTFINMALRCL